MIGQPPRETGIASILTAGNMLVRSFNQLHARNEDQQEFIKLLLCESHYLA